MAGRMVGGGMAGGGAGGGMGGGRGLRIAIARSAADLAIRDENPKSRVIHQKLDEPIAMPFNEETPIEDVLKYIRHATTTERYSGIPIYADPMGLAEAGCTMTSCVRNMELEGVPLSNSLRLLLKQLRLAYCVRDGVLIISSEARIDEELEEMQLLLDSKENAEGARSRQPGPNPQ
jgi:hypothetical protein